jgi:hypothetical protein
MCIENPEVLELVADVTVLDQTRHKEHCYITQPGKNISFTVFENVSGKNSIGASDD